MSAHGVSFRELEKELCKLSSVQSTSFTRVRQGTFIGLVTTTNCPCVSTMLPYHPLLRASPDGEGGLRWTMLLRGTHELKSLLARLEEQGIHCGINKVVKCSDLWSLTERQEEMLRTSLELGFFDVPKKIRVKELAELFRVSPKAVTEVLRRGQKRAISQALGLRSGAT